MGMKILSAGVACALLMVLTGPAHASVACSAASKRASGPELLPLVVAAGVRLVRFERVRPTLEDVFLQLVGARPTYEVA